ncbi:hypothetical protein HDU98_004532 [Podochytrium sp. JEL0797]|nr:hypothetical protein HDU98_004532 [Podochytrium sp. JEL0797]
MIPDSIKIIGDNGTLLDTYSIDQVFYNTSLTTKYGLNAILRGSMSTPTNRYGRGYPAALTSSRFNLCQIDLLRARERSLSTYNDARSRSSLTALTNWTQFTSIPQIQQSLQDLYGSVDNVETLVGAYLDSETGDTSFGMVALYALLSQAVLGARADRWGILNFDVAPRDLEWQNQLISTTYSRSMYDFVKQHTGMACIPTDILRVESREMETGCYCKPRLK